MKKVKRALNILFKLIIKTFMYFCNKIFKVKNNKVVFISFNGKFYSDNPRIISETLYNTYPGHDIVWLITNKKNKSIPNYIRCVKFDSIKAFQELATAKIWVNNFNMPPYIYKSKPQKYIQTWHGDRGFKKILHDSEFRKKSTELFETTNCDLMVSGSNYGTKKYRSAFKYQGEILEKGSPRNDRLINYNQQNLKNLKSNIGIEPNKKVLLFAPTLRRKLSKSKESQDIGAIDLIKTLELLMNKTNDDWVCFIRSHSSVDSLSGFPRDNRIIDVSHYEDMNDILLITDFLITDYSSSAGDFVLLNKPLVLFHHDIDKYTKEDRTFYFEIENSPYLIAHNQLELENIILQQESYSIKENCQDVLNFYESYETGRASEEVVKYIAKHTKIGV